MADEVFVRRGFEPGRKALLRGIRAVRLRQIKSRNFVQGERASRRRFHLAAFRTSRQDREINADELQQTRAFDEDSRRSNTFEREPDALLDLTFGDNQPMDICSSGVPVAASVFARHVSLSAARTNDRFRAEEMADTAGVRVFAAGAVMTARQLDRLPSGEGPQQLADERRLSRIG